MYTLPPIVSSAGQPKKVVPHASGALLLKATAAPKLIMAMRLWPQP